MDITQLIAVIPLLVGLSILIHTRHTQDRPWW